MEFRSIKRVVDSREEDQSTLVTKRSQPVRC